MIPSLIKSALLVSGMSTAAIASGVAQEQLGWQRATQLLDTDASTNQALAIAINQWRSLTQSTSQPFETYAAFLIAHPGWPDETQLRQNAEAALARGTQASPSIVAAYFRRYPPLSNVARVRFAQALSALGSSSDALVAARAAWRAGSLSTSDESAVLATWGGSLAPADHDARMDALLWQNGTAAAARELPYVSPQNRAVFGARLAFRTNAPDAATQAAATQSLAGGDAGYIADRAIWLDTSAGPASARAYLASRPVLTVQPVNREKWFELLLSNARGAVNDHQYATAIGIARVDDAYPAGTDVSAQSYGERDDYTSLVWLAGRTALTQANRPADAIGLFQRYAGGSRGPTVRSKGLYWAGRAAEAAGRREQANGFYTQAAAFHDLFYGQLATERLGQRLAAPPAPAARTIAPDVRQAFYAREVVRAAQYLGTVSAWQDQSAFVRQIANDARSDSDHVLASELSRSLGRPDLGVMIGRSALTNGITDYSTVAFPTVHVPADQTANWVMVHAIARQESQFDRAAVSHAGARGLMQLMPATARQTASQMGLSMASTDQLTTDTDFNISVGGTYFARLYNQYGSYPLAVAAYNAGPGNVNRWLAANGDPRMGSVDWIEWIEAIPIQETRNYVQRVLENAVVYDLLNPERSRSPGGSNRLSWYIGKSRPG